MDNFVYDIGTKIYFGKGQIENLGAAVKAWGDKALLVYGGGSIKKTGVYDKAMESLKRPAFPPLSLRAWSPIRVSRRCARASSCAVRTACRLWFPSAEAPPLTAPR